MIKIEETEVVGWEHAIRGMRNPMNSWNRSDSDWEFVEDISIINPNDEVKYVIGENDKELMMKLANAGSVHAKYRRMIAVYVDVTAPLYWWKEMDTYKVGTVSNSCSTMHKIHSKEFTVDDFSHEHLCEEPNGWIEDADCQKWCCSATLMETIVHTLNAYRNKFLLTNDKKYWWQMIQLLPSSYNQKRTIMLNYEVLANIYKWRKDHKLDEWRKFCKWIELLPYSEIITGNNNDVKEKQEDI